MQTSPHIENIANHGLHVSVNNINTLAKICQEHLQVHTEDLAPNTGEPVKTPIEKRVLKSKMTKLLKSMNDDEVKMVAFALIFNKKVQEATACFHKSIAKYTPIAAIANELSLRNISINKS